MTETNQSIQTNALGRFELTLPEPQVDYHLDISFVGCRTVYALQQNSGKAIYIICLPNNIEKVDVKGLSAKEVVQKAVGGNT